MARCYRSPGTVAIARPATSCLRSSPVLASRGVPGKPRFMEKWVRSLRGVVLDLDGTVYDDGDLNDVAVRPDLTVDSRSTPGRVAPGRLKNGRWSVRTHDRA